MPRVPKLAAVPGGFLCWLWWSAAVSGQGGGGIVSNLNLFMEENAAAHHTEPFKILRGNTPSLVVRRGFSFRLAVSSSASSITIILSLGDNPQAGDGSLVQLAVPSEPQSVSSHPALGEMQWTLALREQDGQARLLEIAIPVTAGVGRWLLTIGADGQHVRARESVYILFNPWHNGDQVFMENDQQRSFYVMQDRGIIFHGQLYGPVAKEWYYGQFEKSALPTAEFLFKIAELPASERGNPIAVSRKLASGVNSKDNNGVVQGRWNPPYSDGVHPFAWSSTSAILNQYMEMGGNTVLYGQCFVFAAVLNTLLRAIGIPSRVVTNFPSVHTDNGGQNLDVRFPGNGGKPHFAGSVWNYHVWNEGWMRRPDLPSGYDGWQVLDGTPQGLSMQSQLFEVGPFPVRGVLEDRINMPYDGNVARAAVKAIYRYFNPDSRDPSGWRLFRVLENQCGRLVATEAIGTGQLQDITHTYKARPVSMARHSREDPVTVKVRHEKKVPVGQPIGISCVVSNNQHKPCHATVIVTVTSVTYNNEFPEALSTTAYNVTLPANQEKTYHITVRPQDYIKTLRGECMISIEATVTYEKDIAYSQSILIVQMPKLNIDVAPIGPNGEVHYNVSLKNPLAIPLSGCQLSLELPGSTRFLRPISVGSVDAYGLFFKSGSMFRTSEYTHEFNAAFTCREMPIVSGYRSLQTPS